MDNDDGGDQGPLRMDDPWHDAAGTGLWVPEQQAAPRPPHPEAEPAADGRASAYLEVQDSAAFREVRDRYRRFVFPMTAAFLLWYLLYLVAATTAPRLMAHQVGGGLNVAMVAGLAQFATTFLLTWAYARHARTRRDRLALDLRWSLATRTGQERVR
ncbi:Uncharacterized membrane protein, DUF485 family [Actinacidiphila rubida]|uniref:Uncharacterized membrane protein, DUF485 family n=2 Tax=Actinacidiphila rubida TaxID=310780 RepID=A0A1H8G0S0_9ACTN|nr:DUF485 domain-containing protein [Actinacidiphila rubida]SEN37576.1 Uncharacterized membrane protein, DUF485 family [Actinacidiphila rubida]